MKFNLAIVYLISFIFSLNSSFLPVLGLERKSTNFQETENNSDLDIDYLISVINDEYILGPGDSIIVSVSDDLPKLIRKVDIDAEGNVVLPKIKRVYVSGLTISELTNLLNKKYSEFVKYPSIEISVLAYRPVRFFLKGEVLNPGFYTLNGSGPYSSNSSLPASGVFFPTVFDAIQKNGGVTEFADLENIKLIRKESISNGSKQITRNIDFFKLLKGNDLNQNIRIYDNDIIIVGSLDDKSKIDINSKITLNSNLNRKKIDVYVTGQVRSPGQFTVSSASTLNDAIQFAGGTMLFKGKVNFVRNTNKGYDIRKFKYNKRSKRGSFTNPKLIDGDLIFVGENLFSKTSGIINLTTRPFIDLFQAYQLYNSLND